MSTINVIEHNNVFRLWFATACHWIIPKKPKRKENKTSLNYVPILFENVIYECNSEHQNGPKGCSEQWVYGSI